MKSNRTVPVLLAFVVASAMLAVGAQTMRIQVESTSVRAKPSSLGKIVGKLAYTAEVQVIEKKGTTWVKVKPAKGDGPTGWVRASAITSKAIQIRAGTTAAKTSASQEEVQLAGKALDEEIEGKYRASKPELKSAYEKLGKIEKSPLYKVDTEVLRAFLAAGGIEPKEGL